MTNFRLFSLLLFTLQLTACGGSGSSEIEQVSPPQIPPSTNHIPNAVDDEFTLIENSVFSGDVSVNDTGLDDTPIQYQIDGLANNGQVTIQTNGRFTYTPAENYIGTDTFTYRVTDTDGDMSSALVTLTVQEADTSPKPQDDTYRIEQNEQLQANVAVNDSLLGNLPVLFQLSANVQYGTLVFSENGDFTYRPNSDYVGRDGFTYLLVDSDGDQGTATVTITIDAVSAGALWPQVNSEVISNVEGQVSQLLEQMTLAEKVGQMIMAEIQSITPEQVAQYNVGAVLNGGGSWPNNNRNASISDWTALADAYFLASIDTTDGGIGIPVIWGTDAVHGHNNVRGATLFPHNIGLGAANNPELMELIGIQTALAVVATGIDLNFAPTLAVARNDRWGRTYESFSEDPNIVSELGDDMIRGLQGDARTGDFFVPGRVIATAKHFIGDGGTTEGVDQGNTEVNEETLRDIHGQGYFTGLAAGAQVVMATYNSWNNNKVHGSEYLLTEVLRNQMGFDGFVLGDWNGHAQVSGCSNASCAQAINAGVDMIMVPTDWLAFYTNTLVQAQNGEIPVARINEAVSRILRVKLRWGIFNKPQPSMRQFAGDETVFSSQEQKDIARQAVRESLVLLKNSNSLLPLSPKMNVLVTGQGADNIPMQAGGWSITWQGNDSTNSDYPNATSIYHGIREHVEAAGGAVTLSADASFSGSTPDVAIVIYGETPYAEGAGDIANLEFEGTNKQALPLLNQLKDQGVPVVSVFLSGRPLWTNKELNASNSFVAAWLPGSEGKGIADVLFRNADEQIAYDFSGKLSFSWPNSNALEPLNIGDNDYSPLFEVGYGLTYSDIDTLGDDLDETGVGSSYTPWVIPGDRLEAENYSAMFGIQTETTTDQGGGVNIGYIDVGDWVEYELEVLQAGNYNFTYRLASLPGSEGFNVFIDGVLKHTITVNASGGWQNWYSESVSIDLSEGQQTLRLEAIGKEWNLNWIEFSQ